MDHDYNIGDTVQVLAPCAYQGEVGAVESQTSISVWLRFADGSDAVFHLWEVRPSQQKLEL